MIDGVIKNTDSDQLATKMIIESSALAVLTLVKNFSGAELLKVASDISKVVTSFMACDN